MTSESPSLYYKPSGAARKVWFDTSPEILLSGPAGTGKSRACLEKLFYAAETYNGMRGLIVRQVRASLSETGLVTWENLVLPPRHPSRGNCSREHRQSYRFPNGSEIVTGGMDKPDKIMSSEYDLIYVQEATELKIEGWEALTTRLRNGVMPYQQLMADCNPSAPTHWLYKRCQADGPTPSTCKMLFSKHEDNPRLYDRKARGYTAEGEKYLAKLDNLTGPRKQRLRWGKWVQAEGAIYENWNAEIHVLDRGPWMLPRWESFWAIDFGYTNPFVWQEWKRDGDGRAYLNREIYKTRTLVEDHARAILKIYGAWDEKKKSHNWDLPGASPKPVSIVCDHDAEDRATFERHTGLATQPAAKAVTAGIQDVAERLNVAGDGRPRLFVVRGARVHAADEYLVDGAKPTCTEEEWDGYTWVDGKAKDTPNKENDHGMDAVRYMVAEFGKPKRAEFRMRTGGM